MIEKLRKEKRLWLFLGLVLLINMLILLYSCIGVVHEGYVGFIVRTSDSTVLQGPLFCGVYWKSTYFEYIYEMPETEYIKLTT